MTFNLTSIRMAAVKTTTNNNNNTGVGGYSPCVLSVGMLLRTVRQLLKKLKIQLSCDPASSRLHLRDKVRAGLGERFVCPRSQQRHNRQEGKTTRCPTTDEWIHEMW